VLNITLLGGASIVVDGAILRSDLGPPGRLLACYLFEFIGRAHRRERLADLFWGDMEPEKARCALNTAIWRIRKILDLGAEGGCRNLVTIGNDVLLKPSAFIQVDTHALQDASRRITNAPTESHLSDTDEQAIDAAVKNYSGPFLDGDDGDWVLQERERLHRLFVRSTLELMRAAARRRQYEWALEFGRRILAADPMRESVQRDVMVLLVLNGQRAEAIRAYQDLKSLLKFDLGIDPMPDTRRLHQEIFSGEIFDRLDGYASVHFGGHRQVGGGAGYSTSIWMRSECQSG
jgi:DNA-binding SARP family transcriptional activator